MLKATNEASLPFCPYIGTPPWAAFLGKRPGGEVAESPSFAFPLAERYHLVHLVPGKDFLAAVRPLDGDLVHPFRLPQAEVGAWIVAAQIAVTRIDESNPTTLAGPDRNLGP